MNDDDSDKHQLSLYIKESLEREEVALYGVHFYHLQKSPKFPIRLRLPFAYKMYSPHKQHSQMSLSTNSTSSENSKSEPCI